MTRSEAKGRSCCRKLSVLWYPGGQARRCNDPSCPEIQGTLISLIIFKWNWPVICVCPSSGRTHQSFNVLLLLVGAAKQICKRRCLFFFSFFYTPPCLGSSGKYNRAAKGSQCHHSETEKAVAGEMCSVSLRYLILYSVLSLETPEDAKYFFV